MPERDGLQSSSDLGIGCRDVGEHSEFDIDPEPRFDCVPAVYEVGNQALKGLAASRAQEARRQSGDDGVIAGQSDLEEAGTEFAPGLGETGEVIGGANVRYAVGYGGRTRLR